MKLFDVLFGRPLATSEEQAEHIGPASGIPIFGLDGLTSAAYGPEAAMALLIPLGFAMGMPFPTGLRALASLPVPEIPASQKNPAAENAVEWAWAMNAASSVMGSVLAMVIAIQYGLNVTLAC